MRALALVVVAAAFSIALGKALDLAPVPPWVEWSILAFFLLVGVLFLRGSLDL